MPQAPAPHPGLDPRMLAALERLGARAEKRPDRVVFIGRGDGQFGGNIKYLFLHCVEHAPDLHPVHLTFNRETHRELRAAGLPSALFPEPGSLEAAAGAGYAVVDDFHFRSSPVSLLLSGARLIQLWHGVGFKKIGFLEATSGLDLTDQRRAELVALYSGYHAVLSTSPFYTEHLFRTCFGAEEVWETGYPRNDILFREPGKADLIQCDAALYGRVRRLAKSRFVALYVPTFRDGGGDPFAAGALDLDALDAALGKMGAVLVVKLHTFSGNYSGFDFQNILYCPSQTDAYPLMARCHCLVTDYSSIYTDWLMLDRPVLFFPYDWEEYIQKNRELQFDYDWIAPGPKLRTQRDLTAALARLAKGGSVGYEAERREIGRLAFAQHDGGACARVLARLRADIAARAEPAPGD
ncbi:MAG: CDP-glycerol glycerophosphotransferase family protein [Desulfovibrionaceae bacterium]